MLTTSVPSRAQQVRNFLGANNLLAWIAWRPDELLMLSGYFPSWGASLLIYFADAEPVLFVPQIEPLDHVPAGLRVREYPWGDLKCVDPYSILVAEVANELKKQGISAERVGMNSSSARGSLPVNAAEQTPLPEGFSAQLASLSTGVNVHTQASFNDLYLRKSAREVDAIRLANRVANVGLQAFFENLQPGVSEAEVAAEVERAIYPQIGRDGIFHSKGWAMVQSGANSAEGGRFNRSTGRKLKNGDLVLLELATCVNGYWSDLTRTEPIGSVQTEVAEILALVKDAQQAAVDGVRPGAPAGEVDAIARERIAAHGLSSFFTHATGHHVGFRYHDPGFPIAPGRTEELESGMVITVEPGVYIPDLACGARIEDNVLVTGSGRELLSRIATNVRAENIPSGKA